MTRKSSQDQAREHLERLVLYLEENETLPARSGRVNVTAIGKACGFDRQTIYKNLACRQLVEDAATRQGLSFLDTSDTDRSVAEGMDAMVPAKKLREEQQRVAALERRLAEMTARNAVLSSRLRQQTHIEEELLSRGRRTRPFWPVPLFDERSDSE